VFRHQAGCQGQKQQTGIIDDSLSRHSAIAGFQPIELQENAVSSHQRMPKIIARPLDPGG
jgi:hypothetical protein